MADGKAIRYAVLGAGAMGSVFGARLARGGMTVELLARNQAHINAINEGGLIATLDGERLTLPVRARRMPDAGEADVVIVFTKSYQLEAALHELPPALADARIMVLLNGLGNGERAAGVVGADRVIEGITMMPGEFVSPGEVASSDAAETWFYRLDGLEDEFLARIGNDFNRAGITSSVTPLVRVNIWQKTCFNAAMNALCGLTMGSPGLLQAIPEGRRLAHELADEALAVADAEGIAVDGEKVHGLIDYACANHTWHRPSMLQDLTLGRRTEIDAINGYIFAAAERHGIAVPLNRLITRLIKIREVSPTFWAEEPVSEQS